VEWGGFFLISKDKPQQKRVCFEPPIAIRDVI
jgi:hypothetical protein